MYVDCNRSFQNAMPPLLTGQDPFLTVLNSWFMSDFTPTRIVGNTCKWFMSLSSLLHHDHVVRLTNSADRGLSSTPSPRFSDTMGDHCHFAYTITVVLHYLRHAPLRSQRLFLCNAKRWKAAIPCARNAHHHNSGTTFMDR